jgi:hypothetical protein
MTKQEVYNRFSFLEGLVNEHCYKKIVETAISIADASNNEKAKLRKGVFTVLEGFTLPHDVRKILEAAYYEEQE